VTYGDIASAAHSVRWDAAAAVACTAYHGQWWQAYFDDPQSVALKVQLADRLGLAGVGVWALGMDGGDPAMISALLGHAVPLKHALEVAPPALALLSAVPPVGAVLA
jgi:GH18 family chitinase